MTAFQKKELEARDEFRREMDAYGLTVSGSISGHYVGDDFAATFRTEAIAKKGCVGMIRAIRSHGYEVEEYARTDKSGKRYFVFVICKTVMIPPSERVEDTAEAAAAPAQSEEKNNPFFDIHYMPREWRALYEKMKDDCPRNDCTIYVICFEQYDTLVRDYDNFAEQMSEYGRRAISRAVSAKRREIMDMYMNNYAVQKFKAEGVAQ